MEASSTAVSNVALWVILWTAANNSSRISAGTRWIPLILCSF
jgi:hypothetical protein